MKRTKQAYVYTNFTSFSLGFGIGKMKGTDIFDMSISLAFWTLGFRTWGKGESK